MKPARKSALLLIGALALPGLCRPAPMSPIEVSPERGFFFKETTITIRCVTPGSSIFYTTDCSEPIEKANATGTNFVTLRITNTTVLRLTASRPGLPGAKSQTHSYIFPAAVGFQERPAGAAARWKEDPPDGDGQSYPANFAIDQNVIQAAAPGYSFTNALLAIPSVSVVAPTDVLFGTNGIYTRVMMRGTNWERAASFELMYPDGRRGVQANAGLRMQGAVSRLNHATPKHPLRLAFREKYGLSKLDFPLFPDSKTHRFDHLILRACSTDAWCMANTVDFLWRNRDATYLRDQWMRDTQLAMGQPSPHGIYVNLYLNGLYWGLYNLTERPGDAFAAAASGGKKSEYDVVGEFNGELRAGTRDAWEKLLALADRAPLEPEAYWAMQGLNPDGQRNPGLPVLIDLDNLIDYMALHIYAPAVDWPNRNWWAARRRGSESTGFKFFVWDQEVAIDRLDRSITWANNKPFAEVNERGTPAQIYDRLRKVPEFRRRFTERLEKHLGKGGALSVEACRARWALRAAEIDHAIVGESARWGDAWQKPPYTREKDWLRMSRFTQELYWPGNHPRALQRFRSVGLLAK